MSSYDWCSTEKRYVPRDTLLETTFGDIEHIHEPLAGGGYLTKTMVGGHVMHVSVTTYKGERK